MKNPNTSKLRLGLFLHPKHWPLWSLLGILYFIVKTLPYPALLCIGRCVGKGYYHLARRARHICQINLRLCFPELSKQEQKALCQENFACMGIAIIEIGLATWGTEKKLKPLCEVIGWEHLEAAKAKEKGVLLLTAHLLSPDLGGRLLRLKTPFSALALIPNNPVMNYVMHHSRANLLGENIHPSNIRALMKRLKANDIIWYAVDQDLGEKHSVFAPFFGIETATTNAISRIAKISGAQMVPFLQYRNPETNAYILEFLPAFNEFPSADPLTDATRINQVFETAIKKQPAHYYWQYKRFSTRPDGAPDVYPTKRRRLVHLPEQGFHSLLQNTQSVITEDDQVVLRYSPDGYWTRVFPAQLTGAHKTQALNFVSKAKKLERKGILTAQIKRFHYFNHNDFYAINFKYFNSLFLNKALASPEHQIEAKICFEALKHQCHQHKIDLSNLEAYDFAYLPKQKRIAVLAPHKILLRANKTLSIKKSLTYLKHTSITAKT